jgi:hypothetical protein
MRTSLALLLVTVLLACNAEESNNTGNTPSDSLDTTTRDTATKQQHYFVCTAFDPELEANDNKAGIITKKRWSAGQTLMVAFSGGTEFMREKVRQFALEWTQHCSIKFNFVKSDKADIRIVFKEVEASWSLIGTDAKPPKMPPYANVKLPPSMNFKPSIFTQHELVIKSIVLHEFGHALGLIHEHQSPGANIPWNRPAVYKDLADARWSRKEVDHNFFNIYSQRKITNSSYDRKSIMHYSILPDWVLDPTFAVPLNYELSNADKAFIRQVYP